jgi:RNA binding exosome subunit
MNNDARDPPEVGGATISVVIHATEDKDKVISKIVKVFSLNSDKFEETNTRGHWGNQIILLNLSLERVHARPIIKTIYTSLDKTNKNYLLSSLEQSIDEKDNLYVRVDKQSICRGEVSLSDQDSIKIKFRPSKAFKQSNKSETYRELLSSEL